MTSASVHEVAAAMRWHYLQANKREIGRFLQEICRLKGYHRKAAIRLLRHSHGQGQSWWPSQGVWPGTGGCSAGGVRGD